MKLSVILNDFTEMLLREKKGKIQPLRNKKFHDFRFLSTLCFLEKKRKLCKHVWPVYI